VISQEHGKTHADAARELASGIDVVDFACGIPHLLKLYGNCILPL
jgi:malonate-semialdehyde dehydrogenase (acetylating)/methylmalonate-semialdehyde dehydrogenase